MGAKFAKAQAICDDSWVINLRTVQENSENLFMDMFMKGLKDIKKELTREWEGKAPEGKPMYELNMTSELQDLLNVYTDADNHMKTKQVGDLRHLVTNMKRFVEGYEEAEKVSNKLTVLKNKMAVMEGNQTCCQGHQSDDEDGDDE